MRCEFNMKIECYKLNNTGEVALGECKECPEYKKFVEEYSKISLKDFNNLADLRF